MRPSVSRLLLALTMLLALCACTSTERTTPAAPMTPDRSSFVADLVVEIHVPLTLAPDVAEDEYAFPWIDDVEEHLAELEEEGVVEVYDDGEELGDHYRSSSRAGRRRNSSLRRGRSQPSPASRQACTLS